MRRSDPLDASAAPAVEAPSEQPFSTPLEDILQKLAEQPAPAEAPSAREPSLRIARVTSVDGARCAIAWRGRDQSIAAEIAPEVERSLVVLALREGDSVLVEHTPGEAPLVVAVLQTRTPRVLHLKAARVEIEAETELLLRAGRSAFRLRDDGEVEVVGSRISVASRGLLRLVGRILRLN